MNTCKTCKYFELFDFLKGMDLDDRTNDDAGSCHRYPKGLYSWDLNSPGHNVKINDWCGEWAKKIGDHKINL
jgi:hypothetical protein